MDNELPAQACLSETTSLTWLVRQQEGSHAAQVRKGNYPVCHLASLAKRGRGFHEALKLG